MEVTCCDAWYSLGGALDGMGMPSPPILAGKANRVRSRSPGGGLPVKAGITDEFMVSSRGFNMGPIPGMVRLRYVHLLIIPCVSAA